MNIFDFIFSRYSGDIPENNIKQLVAFKSTLNDEIQETKSHIKNKPFLIYASVHAWSTVKAICYHETNEIQNFYLDALDERKKGIDYLRKNYQIHFTTGQNYIIPPNGCLIVWKSTISVYLFDKLEDMSLFALLFPDNILYHFIPENAEVGSSTGLENQSSPQG